MLRSTVFGAFYFSAFGSSRGLPITRDFFRAWWLIPTAYAQDKAQKLHTELLKLP
jgi:hypothetical protein